MCLCQYLHASLNFSSIRFSCILHIHAMITVLISIVAQCTYVINALMNALINAPIFPYVALFSLSVSPRSFCKIFAGFVAWVLMSLKAFHKV